MTILNRIVQACIAVAFLTAWWSGVAQARDATRGEDWQKVETVPYRLNNKQDAIAFAEDGRLGLYGNGTGRVYRSADGGRRWTLAWRGSGTYVRALEFVDGRTVLMGNVGPGYFPNVTDTRPLYISRDAGSTWSAVEPEAGPQIAGICAIDVVREGGKAVAIRAGGRVGGPAGIIESFDQGATWRSRDMSAVTGMILDIRFLNASTGFIAGASESDEDRAHARILKTTDGGQTWRAVFDSPRAGENNWKLAFPSDRVGYATIMSYNAPVGEARGYVAKTEDGGENWRVVRVTRDREWIPYGISFISETRGWVGGSTGGFETKDGGATWHPAAMGLSTNKMRILPRPDGGQSVLAIGQDLRRLEISPPN